MKITAIRFEGNENGNFLSYVSVTIDGKFVINEMRIIRRRPPREDLMLCMPSRKKGDGSFVDVAHPITPECRKEIERAVFDAWESATQGAYIVTTAGKTPSAEEAEYLKKLLDPVFFIESCLFIINKDSKKVPFILNESQRRFMRERKRRDIILKSRKMGFSTLSMALSLHMCVTRENTYAVLVSHEKEATGRLFDRLKYMIMNSVIPINTIPKDLSNFKGDEIRFPDTSSKFWIGTAGSKNFGRGDDVVIGLLSEPAFYESLDVITGISEALVNDATLTLESTANGAGNPYHNLWVTSENGETNYKTHFYPWFDETGYRIPSKAFELDEQERKIKEAFKLDWDQLQWRKQKIRDMQNPDLFPQEYPATAEEAFLSTGRMLFDWDAVRKQDKAKHKPKWRGRIIDMGDRYQVEPDEKGQFLVWRTPDDRCDYLITVDTGEGIPGRDYSVADVWDCRTWEQVAQWRGHFDTDRFSDVVYRIGAYYKWAVIAPETNSHGNALMLNLRMKQYPHMWIDPQGDGKMPGMKTTRKSKPIIVNDGRAAVRELDIKVNSRYTLNELKTFIVTETGEMEAQKGCHDDTIITLCIAAYILKRWALDGEAKRFAFKNPMNRRRRGHNSYGYKQRQGNNTVI